LINSLQAARKWLLSYIRFRKQFLHFVLLLGRFGFWPAVFCVPPARVRRLSVISLPSETGDTGRLAALGFFRSDAQRQVPFYGRLFVPCQETPLPCFFRTLVAFFCFVGGLGLTSSTYFVSSARLRAVRRYFYCRCSSSLMVILLPAGLLEW